MNALFYCFDSNTLNLRELLKLQTNYSRFIMFVFSITLKNVHNFMDIFDIKFWLLVVNQTQRSRKPQHTGQRSICLWSERFACRFFGGHATPLHPKVKAAVQSHMLKAPHIKLF